mmetsp:Transcript_37823/g.84360  ORF Transcript_37823/g.84360 Transcript_37823/m.84360 type:complete len:84 (-) Transcript_37823:98-349(-)
MDRNVLHAHVASMECQQKNNNVLQVLIMVQPSQHRLRPCNAAATTTLYSVQYKKICSCTLCSSPLVGPSRHQESEPPGPTAAA